MKPFTPRENAVKGLEDHLVEELARLREENDRLRENNERIYKEMLRFRHAISTLNPNDETRLVHAKLNQLQQAIGGLNRLVIAITQAGTPNLGTLVKELLETALLSTDTENGSLILLDEDKQELVFVEVLGAARERILGFRMPARAGVVGSCVRSRRSEFIEDVAHAKVWSPEVQNHTGFDTQSLICVPIYEHTRAIGAIEVVSSRAEGPLERDNLEVLELIAKLGSLALASLQPTRRGGKA